MGSFVSFYCLSVSSQYKEMHSILKEHNFATKLLLVSQEKQQK